MFNLYQIVQGAQGGQAIDNLAQRFGLSKDQADAAVRSLIPALSTGFMTKAAQPGGYGEIVGAMGDDQHRQAYADPAAAQDPATQQKGGAVLGSLFGQSAIIEQVAEQASRFTGIPAATLAQMLPVIASMVVGGVATAMHNQGLGGFLGQLAGMLGQSGFGQAAGPSGGNAPAGGMAGPASGDMAGPAPGGLGGVFGSLFGNIMGGMGQPGAAPAAAPTMPPAMQMGMDALSKMFQPGVQPIPGQASGDLSDQISSILGGKR